jgi:uncharacterized protein (DUF1697 family)
VSGPYALLLRGIGPPTHKIVTMSALADACQGAGIRRVTNVLATGNLILDDPRPPADLVGVARQTATGFGLRVAMLIRPVSHLRALLANDPDPAASAERPGKVQVTFLDPQLTADALTRLRARATVERVEPQLGELWVDYRGPVHTSKLTGAVIERVCGGVHTARNWRTLQRLVVAAEAMA